MSTTATAPASGTSTPQVAAERAALAWGARSRALAAAGDLRAAVHTQWAADLATFHVLLWESGLAAAPDPAAQLDTLAHVVRQALSAPGTLDAHTLRETLEAARGALAAAFGQPVATRLAERFVPLDHLPEAAPASVAADGRVGASPRAVLATLRENVADCTGVARALAAAGYHDDARRHLRRARLAALEAFLLERTPAGTPAPVVTAGLRWELAAGLPGSAHWAALDPDDLVEALVEALAVSDPSADLASLRTRLEEVR